MRVSCWMVLICFVFMISGMPYGPTRAQEAPWQGQEPIETKTPVGLLDLDARGTVSGDEAAMLSDRLRIELFRTGAFDVMERNKMQEILEEQQFQLTGCTDQTCAVQIGRLIGVQKMVAGSVGKIGDLYTVSLWMVDVESGRMEKTAVKDYEGRVEELMKTVMQCLAQELAGTTGGEAGPHKAGTGDLYIVTEPPGATVTVDGAPQTGATPLIVEGVQIGAHTVRATKGTYEGEANVLLREGEIQKVSMALQELTGNLKVLSDPFEAEVFVDGRSVGTTPVVVSDLSVGKHRVKWTKVGYTTTEQTVIVRSKETVKTEARLIKIAPKPKKSTEEIVTTTPTPKGRSVFKQWWFWTLVAGLTVLSAGKPTILKFKQWWFWTLVAGGAVAGGVVLKPKTGTIVIDIPDLE